MKKVEKLTKQKSNWRLAKTHFFNNRNYQVDNKGNFYKDGNIRIVKQDSKGSFWFCLRDDDNNKVRFKIHQIVMQTFDPKGLKDFLSVDHIDRNRSNNSIENLRFATREQQYQNRVNITYKQKKVRCLNNNKIYNSCQEAEIDLELAKNTVSPVARGEKKSIRSYKFEYLEL